MTLLSFDMIRNIYIFILVEWIIYFCDYWSISQIIYTSNCVEAYLPVKRLFVKLNRYLIFISAMNIIMYSIIIILFCLKRVNSKNISVKVL